MKNMSSSQTRSWGRVCPVRPVRRGGPTGAGGLGRRLGYARGEERKRGLGRVGKFGK
jgi:hypothetical protein